jgi:hypothetical protein
MDAWAEIEGLRTWHARAFLRLVLRQPPEGIVAAEQWAAWRCSAAGCSTFRPDSGIAAVAHASSCGELTRRHNAYAAAVREILHKFPGRPQLRVEVTGIPDEDSRMDVVVTGAAMPAEGEPGSPPDGRTLLIDFSITEPLGLRPMTRGAYSTAGVAIELRRKEKLDRYGALIDKERHRFMPWVVESWGRHDEWLVEQLRGAAKIAAEAQERPSAQIDDDAEKRRVARVQATIFNTWMQRLSAGLVAAVAEHFDGRFRPLRGTVVRQTYRNFVPAGMAGGCSLDEGILGVSGHVRSMEPRFAFAMAAH